MNIKSSDGREIKVPAKFQARAKALINAGNHSGMEALYKEIESESFKKGGMLKRKDGSYSRRGLWDNIRANRGSGRKPTKKMLEQERKIRAKQAAGGVVFKGYVTEQPISEPVPFHTSTIGEKMGKGGYTVKRSSARKGKTHVVIGPDGTKKYFGDSKLGQHPKDPGRKKSFYARHAKNLKNNPYFRAFARATWADGGKLGQGIYDMGLMPYGMGGHTQEGPMSQLYAPHTGESVDIRYADGGYIFAPKMDYDGRINVPYGYNTPAYNERYKMNFGGLGGFWKEWKKTMGDTAVFVGDTALGATGLNAAKDVFTQADYKSKAFSDADKYASGLGDLVNTAGKIIPVTSPYFNAVSAGANLADTAFNLNEKYYDPSRHQSGLEKTTGFIKNLGNAAGSFVNPATAASSAISKGAAAANTFSKYANLANMGVNFGEGISKNQFDPMQMMQMGMMANNMFGGSPYNKYADGGQTGLVPINVEGANFSSGSGPNAKKGELLVINGKIIKNYVGRPPHPTEGQNPMGNDDAPEGLIVIPKARTAEYLEAGLEKRKQIEKSLVSQQQDREMKKSRKMGDGGYYSFGMGEMGMRDGGPIGNPEEINDITYGTMKKGGWIQKATASIKRRGTEGVCTGSKFGSSSCPPGSRRYNLAKTFRKMAKARKHEHGGFVDPVTGSHTVMYAAGGQLPEGLLRTRMRASGASPEEINRYVAAKYEMGGATNVTHDFPIRRLRYDVNAVTSGGNYTNVGAYNDFVNSTFEANNPYYVLPSNFSNKITPIQIPLRLGAQAPALNTSGTNEFADWQNALRVANPGLNAQSAYVAPSTMLDAESQRRAAGQRAGQIVNQAQAARMASAPPASYFTTPTNSYYSGTSGAGSTAASSAAAPRANTPMTGYMPGTRRSSGPVAGTNRPSNPAARAAATTAPSTSANYETPIIVGEPSGTSPYAAGVMSPGEYANSLGWNTPNTSSYNYTGPGSYASWGPEAMGTAAPATSTFQDFLNSSESNSPVVTGPNGYEYSINPTASEKDVNKFFKSMPTTPGQGYNWSNAVNDAMRLSPALANFIAAASKREYLDASKYMQPGIKFRPGQFDRTPYETARSRAMYALRQAGAGPGYKSGVAATASGLGQAESRDRMAWNQNELLRQQQIDAMNADITGRNLLTQREVDTKNREIRATGQNLAMTGFGQLGQIGAENEYLNIIGGRNPRKMFTGYREPVV